MGKTMPQANIWSRIWIQRMLSRGSADMAMPSGIESMWCSWARAWLRRRERVVRRRVRDIVEVRDADAEVVVVGELWSEHGSMCLYRHTFTRLRNQ